MAPRDLDFGAAINSLETDLTTPNHAGDGTDTVRLSVSVKRAGQFAGDDLHVSRDGMEKLLLAAGEKLPTEIPATKTPDSTPAASTTATTAPTKPDGGAKLTR